MFIINTRGVRVCMLVNRSRVKVFAVCFVFQGGTMFDIIDLLILMFDIDLLILIY